uniref:Uncharacterized protein n=1 Tax=Meloidogyne enterolobii TaxID=390850 RepID=A0A6V7X3D6_MELEN|nr:unnamed protein product [Meloidogyne enterolobii]
MAFPKIAKKLFHNNRVYIWITFCNLYGLYWLLFRHPYIFNGLEFGDLYDPLTGYIPFRMEFFKEDLIELTIHNTILAAGSPIIYTLFAICLIFKFRALSNKITKEEIMVFIQVFIISMFNTSTGIVYSYNLKNPDSGYFLQMLANFSWLHVHGFPPIVYLTLNKTIRNDTKILFKNIRQKISPIGNMNSMLG